MFEGRQRVDLAQWLEGQGPVWCEQGKVVVADLHEPFRKAATEGLSIAVLVADPMHVVMAANRCPDKTRRRVQNEELLHRGRTGEPLYEAQILLLTAAERLSPRLAKRLDVMLAFGDPNGQVYEAWMTKNWSMISTRCGVNPTMQPAGFIRSSRNSNDGDRVPTLRSLSNQRPSRHRRSELEPPQPRPTMKSPS
jgi:Transposase